MKNILIGGAWPYANGSLHIGHIAGLLPGDVLARYHRAIGDNVYFVSGSDCHGTPVAIRAKKDGKTPQEISDFYHEEFQECFEKLGFSYDVYTKTSSEEHKNFVRDFHAKLYESEYILPSLLICNDEKWHLPDQIISSEYLTLEGRKISTSQNYAIWIKDLLENYDPDSIRYYFLANGPEKKDSDFSWREYVYSYNGELLGAYGNFVNRSLSFINKYWNGIVPDGIDNGDIREEIDCLYLAVGKLIEKGAFKDAIKEIFDYIRVANKFFDTEQPWITRVSNETACKNTLYQCLQIIANLAVLLYPFLPFSSGKVCKWLNVNHKWEQQFVLPGYQLPQIEILFQRLDKKVIETESEKLKAD